MLQPDTGRDTGFHLVTGRQSQLQPLWTPSWKQHIYCNLIHNVDLWHWLVQIRCTCNSSSSRCTWPLRLTPHLTLALWSWPDHDHMVVTLTYVHVLEIKSQFWLKLIYPSLFGLLLRSEVAHHPVKGFATSTLRLATSGPLSKVWSRCSVALSYCESSLLTIINVHVFGLPAQLP